MKISLIGLSVLTLVLSSQAKASELAPTRVFPGNWAVYCLDNIVSAGSCTIAKAVFDNDKPQRHVKVAFFYQDGRSYPTLTIVTPRIDHIGQGVSISADGVQLGYVKVDQCPLEFCSFKGGTDDQLMSKLISAKVVGVEYQESESQDVRLYVNFSGFEDAWNRVKKRETTTTMEACNAPMRVNVDPRASIVNTSSGNIDSGEGCDNVGPMGAFFPMSDPNAPVHWAATFLRCYGDLSIIYSYGCNGAGERDLRFRGALLSAAKQLPPNVSVMVNDKRGRLPEALSDFLLFSRHDSTSNISPSH